MNLLIICPDFYEYKNLIIKSFNENYDGNVFCFSERPSGFFYNVSRTFNKSLRSFLEKRYLTKIKETINSVEIDHVIIIRGEIIDEDFINHLKYKNKKVKIINYQWDSVANNINILKTKDLYDKVISFDIKDCEKYQFDYLPLFWVKKSNGYFGLNNKIGFIGSYHSDRLNQLNELAVFFKEFDYKLSYKLYIPFLAYIKNMLKGNVIPINKIFFRKKEFSDIELFYSNVSIVLELPSSTQVGVPLRLFESIAMNKYIIADFDRDFIIKSIPELSHYILNFSDIKNGKKHEISNDKISINQFSLNSWVNKLLYYMDVEK